MYRRRKVNLDTLLTLRKGVNMGIRDMAQSLDDALSQNEMTSNKNDTGAYTVEEQEQTYMVNTQTVYIPCDAESGWVENESEEENDGFRKQNLSPRPPNTSSPKQSKSCERRGKKA